MHINTKEQIRAKQYTIERLLNIDHIKMVTESPLHYRRVARLHFTPADNGILGFLKGKSNKIVEVNHCRILSPRLDRCIIPFKKALIHLKSKAEISFIKGIDDVWLHIFTKEQPAPEFYTALRAMVPDWFKGIILNVNGIKANIAGTSEVITKGTDNRPLLMPAGSFGQANELINRQMAQTLQKWIKKSGPYSYAVELFSGAGNFSISIAPLVQKLICCESDKDACHFARLNMKTRNFTNTTVLNNDVLNVYRKHGQKCDLVISDPPRTGHTLLAREMARNEHRTVIYISCNPVTLKRDLDILEEGGFRLTMAAGFDMFPHTPHVETMVMLNRR
jgi:23S rRNA (uracil1939-C5)-methyltransferase